MAHLNKKSLGAESQQNKNVFRSRLNSLRHMSRCRSVFMSIFHVFPGLFNRVDIKQVRFSYNTEYVNTVHNYTKQQIKPSLTVDNDNVYKGRKCTRARNAVTIWHIFHDFPGPRLIPRYRIKARWHAQFYFYASYTSCSNSKKWLKSVYIYGSYRKIKTGVTRLWKTPNFAHRHTETHRPLQKHNLAGGGNNSVNCIDLELRTFLSQLCSCHS